MRIEHLFSELELLLSDMAFSGLRNLQPITIQKLEDLKHWMKELNMQEGVRLIDRFIDAVYAYQSGRGTVEGVADSLCALEFYEKHVRNL